MEKKKPVSVNNTEGALADSDAENAAIKNSASKNNAANKVYPATDCDDKNNVSFQSVVSNQRL